MVSQVGTPEELYDAPTNEFIARFLGSGNIFRGEIVENNSGHLVVQVNGSLFSFLGEGDIGEQVTFSVKPEDVIISTDAREEWAEAEVLAITPQVGAFKVAIELDDIQLIALTTDEQLVKQLRTRGDKGVYFSFDPESVFIFR
jgi:ABC-type Fe3+/spermidine/putrescine transport system ATPase subunit